MFLRKLKIIGLMCVVFAVVAAAMLPFFAVYNTSTLSADTSSVFGDKILICKAGGFEWVSLNELLDDEDHPETPSHLKCPVCFLASQNGQNQTVQTIIAVEYSAAYQRVFYHADISSVARITGSPAHPSRAPPISKIV